MKYLNGKFAVSLGGTAYAEGWERTFGKSQSEAAEVQETHVCGARLDDVCERCPPQEGDVAPLPEGVECSGGSCRRVR
jgi:hypothetical protein